MHFGLINTIASCFLKPFYPELQTRTKAILLINNSSTKIMLKYINFLFALVMILSHVDL